MGSWAPESSLQVGIVGAGVAGLSAAIALRKAGHQCEVFERSQFRNEAGAAVSIPPNGGRILESWDFDPAKARGLENIQVRRPRGDTLQPMAPTLNFSNVREKYGSKWFFYHRVDMHNHLKEIAVDQSTSSIPPATIRLGSQVMDMDPDAGIIILKDGTEIQKDLIVVADGQHDRLNAKVTGKEVPMQRSGQTAYRCLIPFSEIMKDEATRPLFENEQHGFWAPALLAKGVMAVTYPCRGGEILNGIVVSRRLGLHQSHAEDVAIEDWNFPATHEDLEKVLEGFHPSIKALFMKSPEVKVYTQMKRNPFPTLTRSKAVLIGDACHPMLLTHAQGVSSSIEDAAALQILLSSSELPKPKSVTSPASSTLLHRLSLFESLRLPRVSATQLLTDPIPPGPNAGPAQTKLETEIRKYYSGPLPPKDSVPHSPAICDFFFGYDVRGDAERVLKADTEGKTMPSIGEKIGNMAAEMVGEVSKQDQALEALVGSVAEEKV